VCSSDLATAVIGVRFHHSGGRADRRDQELPGNVRVGLQMSETEACMSDPRDRDFRTPGLERRGSANAAWGWIAGAVFVVILLILVFGYGMNQNTASNDTASPPAATTGAGASAPRASTPAPANPGAPANPSNGGQAR
jgi:hypothetical protein